MSKRLSFLSATLAVVLAVTFVPMARSHAEARKYSKAFFNVFDTVITYISFAESEAEFDRQFAFVQAEMTRYHQIFDQYHAYSGVQNLFAVNEKAGSGPAAAEPELIALLSQVRTWRETYSTKVNPAMGTVLALWHETRDNAKTLPTDAALAEAGKHCSFDDVLIDAQAGTIAFSDPLLRLDIGAVAKGYAAQCVADALQAQGVTHFILNAGGNVVCGDAPLDGRTAWTIAVEDTDGVSIRHRVYATNRSFVTSGDYQRYVTINGVNYHHLIDPVTLYPSSHVRSVTIVCGNSGLADFLSTAAFLMPIEESLQLIESIDDCEACWLLPDHSEVTTSGYAAYTQQP